MGDGRVTDIRPRTLKRISYYKSDEKSKSYADKIKLIVNALEKQQSVEIQGRKKAFNIPTNNNDHSNVYFTQNNSSERIPHIDGILLDHQTGQLRYFIAKEDVVGKGLLEKIVEGSKVSFSSEPRGLCEIILHKRDAQNNIIGDIDLTESEPAIVEFVEIESIDEYPEISPQYKPLKLRD
ncbi:hypothetical protein OKW21_003228 [Catalinimonas alkaloidigena]|uniref:hypothetical protein n=1 Tax=Catalinimonas alkaloidigena TaxID=1075417 RepID=UPI0024053DAC|nr:hypothetical protein [Catalinimonas alkaloidigena]MDF9797965.1 hypothetical protein [Catalinimonas alkaloidigena]